MINWLRTHFSEDAKNNVWGVIVFATIVLGIGITYYLLTHELWWVLIVGAVILVGIAALESR